MVLGYASLEGDCGSEDTSKTVFELYQWRLKSVGEKTLGFL